MPNISNLVKSIQDIMRKDAGTYGDAQRIEQMAWLFFLKIFDDRETQMELFDDNYKSPMKPRLRWRNWAADEEGITGDALLKFINDDLLPFLKNLTAGKDNIAGLIRMTFEDANNYMKNGTLMRQVINKINDINFNASEDRQLFGDIYEKILKDLQSAGNAGEFYTPRAVTRFIVDQVNPRLGETVMDPACGTGGFLTCAIDHLRDQAKTEKDMALLQDCFSGIEKKHLPHVLCMTNLMLHGIEANFPGDFRTRETADLFLVLIMRVLKPGGRAGLVLPDGTLFGEGVKTRIKEKLLEECNLHTIVRLPNGVFNPYTGIRTNLLFFTKGQPTKEVWCYEHPYPKGAKSYNKGKPIRIAEFEPEKEWWGKPDKNGRYSKRQKTEQAWCVSIEEIKAGNYNLDLKNPHNADEGPGNVDELLPTYEKLLADIFETRNRLRDELKACLERGE